MTIIQAILASEGATPSGPPPPTAHNFSFEGDDFYHGLAGANGWWWYNGGAYSYSQFSDPAPAWISNTYATYTGHAYSFTGSEWMASPDLRAIPGAFATNVITLNYWFYPTANNIQLLSEMGVNNPPDNSHYHYTVLETDSSGYVHFRWWNATSTQSTNTVNLNAWNHVFFKENASGGHTFELNGVATTGITSLYRIAPTSECFVIGFSDTTNMVTSNRFQGKIGWIRISDSDVVSSFANERNVFGI